MKLSGGQIKVVGQLRLRDEVKINLRLQSLSTGFVGIVTMRVGDKDKNGIEFGTSQFDPGAEWPTVDQWRTARREQPDTCPEIYAGYVLATLAEKSVLRLEMKLVESGSMNVLLTLGHVQGLFRLTVDRVNACGCFVDSSTVRIVDTAEAK